MKRLLIAAAALLLVLLVGVAAAYVWYRHEQTAPLPERRGSPTVEFVTTEAPAPVRPKRVVLNQPWPTYGYNNARTRDAEDFDHRPPYRGVWGFRAGHIIEFPPVVAYNRLFVLQQKGRVFSLEAATGKVKWRRRFKHCAASSPAVWRGVVFVALMQPYPCRRYPRSQPGLVAAITARGGRVLWRFPAGAVESSPLVVRGRMYFGSWDHHLYAVDVRGKKPRLMWRFEADGEINSSPAQSGRRIFFGTDAGRVYAVDAFTGKQLWRGESFSRFGRREDYYATVAVAYGRVYAANTDGNVYAFGAGSGRLLWASNAGSYVYSAPAVWNQTVYAGSYDGYFYAFDAATGARKWRTRIGASIHGAPTVMNGLVYFATCGTCGGHGSRYAASGPRRTYALDARTGKKVWEYPVGHYSPVVADSERIYVAGSTRIYALEDRSRPRSKKTSKPARTRPANGQTR